jgi:hypothetical protein
MSQTRPEKFPTLEISVGDVKVFAVAAVGLTDPCCGLRQQIGVGHFHYGRVRPSRVGKTKGQTHIAAYTALATAIFIRVTTPSVRTVRSATHPGPRGR